MLHRERERDERQYYSKGLNTGGAPIKYKLLKRK